MVLDVLLDVLVLLEALALAELADVLLEALPLGSVEAELDARRISARSVA